MPSRCGSSRPCARRARSPVRPRGSARRPARSPAARSCRWRRRARRRAAARRRRRRGSAAAARPAARSPPAATRQRRSGRPCSVPRPLHGGSTSTASNGPSVRGCGGVGGLDADDRLGAQALDGAAQRVGASRVALDRDDLARAPTSAARCVALPPGAAHRSSTRGARCGREQARGAHRRARLRDERAGPPQRIGARIERRLEDEALGDRSVAEADSAHGRRLAHPAPPAPPRTASGSATSVLTRSAPSAGSFTAASSARASSEPSASHHSSAIQSGTEWRTAAPRGRRVVERGEQRPALAPGAPQHRVDELEARPAGRLRQLDALVDGGVRRDAVEEQQLQHAEPQRVAHRRVEPLDRPAGAGGDHVVERAAALHRAVGELRRERALARVEPGARRLGRERAVGVRAVPLDAPQHRRGDAAGGRDGGGGRGSRATRREWSQPCVARYDRRRARRARSRARTGPAGVPAGGAADAGDVVRGAHPARLLRRRVPGARRVRRVAPPPHRRPAVPHARAPLDARHGRAVRRRRRDRHDPVVRAGDAVAGLHGDVRVRLRARVRARGLLLLPRGDLHRDLRLRLGSPVAARAPAVRAARSSRRA